MTISKLKVGDGVHLYGHPHIAGPVSAVGDEDGVGYAKFQCVATKRETEWLRFDQLRRTDR